MYCMYAFYNKKTVNNSAFDSGTNYLHTAHRFWESVSASLYVKLSSA